MAQETNNVKETIVTNHRSLLLPELSRNNKNGMAPSSSFFRGLYRRFTRRIDQKVFVIGFHKTGTTSLAKALAILGYRVCGFISPENEIDSPHYTREELFRLTLPLFHQYDAFEDTPWFIFYRELLKAFPRGRFILTVRDSEKWYKSMTKHFGGYDRESFRWIYEGYGDPLDNKKLYISKYRQHNRDVQNYFREKDKDLLVMSMPQDFNWEILCGYLECSPPFGSFPHANTASSRDSVKRKMIDLMKHKYYRYNS